jgi:hypothetical protein
MRAKRVIAILSSIVIVGSVGITINAISDDPLMVAKAPVVNADEIQETTTESLETATDAESETTTTETTEEETVTSEEMTTTEETTTTTEETTTTTSTTVATTTTKATTATTVSTTTTKPYIVYKPKTHYFHMSTCRWCDKSCVKEWDINQIEGRICSECKPEIELVNEYKPPVTNTEPKQSTSGPYSMSNLPVSQSDFCMLANLVAHEYGADWVKVNEKAKVVMTVMNRVRDKRYPNTISGVILQKNQYCWVPNSYYWKRTTQGCKDAVIYYFNHQDEFSTKLNSFWGDGRVNHFYAS